MNETPMLDRRRAGIAGLLIACAWATVLVLRGPLAGLAELYPAALPAHPWFLPGQALRLWVMAPLGVAALMIVMIAPGALIVLATGAARDVGGLALKGFGVSYLLRFAIHAVAILAGLQWGASLFVTADLLVCAAALFLVIRRAAPTRPDGVRWSPVESRRLLAFLVFPAVLTVALIPLIFWQDITADGLEALTSGLSLNEHVLPRFPNSIGLMGLGIGMSAMAYPTHWFTTLLGPIEAAARLPALLHAPVLLLTLFSMIEFRAPRRLRPLEELAVAVAVIAFVVTLGFNGSYEPYAADLSAPTAFESLTVLAMAAAMLSLWKRETAWFTGFTLLTYFARPTGFLFLLLVAAGSVALERAERRAWLWRIGLGVLACAGLWVAFEKVFIGIAGQGQGRYMTESITQRLQYIRFFDARRFLFVLVPTGVLPALALFAVRRQDRLARALTVFCALYFAFFFVQAFVALHHFAPLMAFPVVVFWRVVTQEPARRWPVPAALAGALLGVALAIPPGFDVFRTARPIGRVLAYEAGDLIGSYPEYRAARDRLDAITLLFANEVDTQDPAERLALAPDILAYYAARYRPAIEAADYVVRDTAALPPAGFLRVGQKDGMAAFVRDTARWQAVLSAVPRTDFRSPLYAMSRDEMLRYRGIRAGRYDFDLATLPFIWRFF